MVIERWRRVESLFHAAHEKTLVERARFLDEACGGDEMLRLEVESLLTNEELAASFLESSGSTLPLSTGRETIPSGEQIGPYTILEFLGAGGMGQVYKAHDKRLDRHVAIKFLQRIQTGDPLARERFGREARTASALNHPNICTVHDVGELQGSPFIVMELLEGQSLKDRIARQPLPLAEFFSVSLQVCAALEAAHAKGIVHRDVKPGNIFLVQGGQVKILDFGLAKRGLESRSVSGIPLQPDASTVTLSHTDTGLIAGTLAYMSPEQAVGGEVDARSDIFSLGVVLYELATGQLPFRGKTPAGIMGSILTESPVRPSALKAGVPGKLDRIILKALEKEREARYQSIVRLSADVDECRQAEAAITSMRTRRWVLTAAGAGAASLAGSSFLLRKWLFPPERKVRIAVLPFESIGGNAEEAVLADGLHQDMISVLNRLYPERLGVIGRTSVRRYQAGVASIDQIGRELNVNYVVEGGIQRDGAQAHVTARLIRVRDQTPIWSATYDRNLGQVLAAQAEIAQAIAERIESGLRPEAQVSAALSRPLKASAHEAYLRRDYAKAIELDPGYAAAYTEMAQTSYYPGLFGFQPPRETFTSMMNAASKALELDPTQATAHASLALGRLHLQWDWSESEAGFRRALLLNPNDPDTRHFYAHLLLWSGRAEESIRECDYALNADPFDAGLISCLGFHYLQVGDEKKALQETLRGLAIEPNHFWGLMTIGWIYEQKGMYEESLGALRKVPFDCGLKRSSIGHAFARLGDRRMAEKTLGEMLAKSKGKYVSPCDIAIIYIGLGDMDPAFQWLNRAYEEHAGWLMFLNTDPRFKPLRSDRRFQDLLRGMQFPNQRA